MKAVKLLSVSVLSFLPSFAFSQDQAKADGPLGFIWGSSVAQAPVEYVSQIDLTRAQDILSELPQYECMQQITTDGVELATYSKALKVDDFFDAPYQMNINEADVIYWRASFSLPF